MSNFFKRLAGLPYIGNLLKMALDDAFDPNSGHTHDGTAGNGGTVASTVPASGSVTDDMLATDVKAGSLAALTTTEKGSLVGAINEVDANANQAQSDATSAAGVAAAAYVLPGTGIPETDMAAAVSTSLGLADSAYQLPGAGIPSTDMSAAVQASLGLADTALQPSGGSTIIRKQITLGGASPTQVKFMGADVAATLLGSVAEPYAITAAQTFVVNPDGAGDVTATFNGARGTSKSGDTASQNMSASLDTKIKIAVDGGAATEVTFAWAGCVNGALIATEMQTKIQALGGAFAAVTVAFAVDDYVITSGIYGTGSSVVVTRADDHNATEELELGPDGAGVGGVETAGTGDAVNLAATSAAEVATKLAGLAGLTAAVVAGAVRITSDTAGAASSLAVNAACALDTVFGITGTDYGEEGLGLSSDMTDTNYAVYPSYVNDAAAEADPVPTIGNKATTGFNLRPVTGASTAVVDLLIFGTPA